jgi:hypothetical protein
MGVIAGNTKHTGDRRKDNRGYAESWTSEQVDSLLSEAWLRQMVTDIRSGKEELKDDLPYICPHYSAFRNCHRAQKDIIPEAFTFMTCVDVDDLELVAQAIRRAQELNGDAYSDWQDQVLRIGYSARKKVHIYIRIPKGMTIEEAQQAFCREIEVPYDESCITPERFIYVTGKDEEVYRSAHWLEPLTEEEIAERREAYLLRGLDVDGRPLRETKLTTTKTTKTTKLSKLSSEKELSSSSLAAFDLCAQQAGLNPNAMDIWGEHNWHANLMAVLSVGVAKLMSRQQLQAVVAERLPNYSQTEDCQKLIDYFYEKYDADKGFMNASLREINAKAQKKEDVGCLMDDVDEEEITQKEPSLLCKKLPQGVRESIEAAGPSMAMAMVTAICPCIGALATGVVLDVHGKKKGLNLIAYIAGDFASCKGDIDPVVEAWMSEVSALDKMYQTQEDEWRAKKLAAKNKKDQPEEPKLPVRFLTLNNTVANLAERLANTEGKHAFSFTPEADTVAQKWKSAMSDFSVMLRQSYDGSKYDREAKSVEAVKVHIDHLLWNVTMCGTPDALFRVVRNYTDGLQSRIALARTPDNTFTELEDKPPVLTPRQTERIRQIAHLLPLMQGEVVLPKLEAKGRQWLERIRLETMMNDDRVKARQRFRVCVTTQRMTCCLMLCKVCEGLIQKHGLSGAETQLKQHPNLWKELLLKAQTPQMLDAYDVIADSLMENALYFFRERIETAFASRDYVGYLSGERMRRGKNDSIYGCLDMQFTFEQAMQQSIAVKGAGVTRNTVQQMLKNWKKQGLVVQTDDGKYRKSR